MLHYGKKVYFEVWSFLVIWVSQPFGDKNRFQQLWMYRIFKIANFHVFHVWGKRILCCNDTTFLLFLILQRNFFPLRSRHQTSETKLRYSQSSAFYRQPKERQNEGHIKYVAMHIFVVAPKSVTSIYLGILYLGKKVR